MESLEQIKTRVEAAVPGASLTVVPNPGPAGQESLVLDHPHAVEVATFLRDDPKLQFDYCSNVTGVDWLDRVVKTKVAVKMVVDGEEKDVTETHEESIAGYLEAVYHLYSIEKRHGPLVIRLRIPPASKTPWPRVPRLKFGVRDAHRYQQNRLQ